MHVAVIVPQIKAASYSYVWPTCKFKLLLFDNEALTSKSATIKRNNFMCEGYPRCKHTAVAST